MAGHLFASGWEVVALAAASSVPTCISGRLPRPDWAQRGRPASPWRAAPPLQAVVSVSHLSGEIGLRTLPRSNLPLRSSFKFVIVSVLSSDRLSFRVASEYVLASSARQFQVPNRLSFRATSFSRLRPVSFKIFGPFGSPLGRLMTAAVCRAPARSGLAQAAWPACQVPPAQSSMVVSESGRAGPSSLRVNRLLTSNCLSSWSVVEIGASPRRHGVLCLQGLCPK